VAAAFVQVGRVAVLGVQCICGDHGVGEVDPIQQWRKGGDLVALVVDLHLAHHDTAGVLECGEQVPCRAVSRAGAARGLAVHRDRSHRLVGRALAGERSTSQADSACLGVRVDGLQDSAKRGLTGGAPADPEPDPHRYR
jgi:hypothetical protein